MKVQIRSVILGLALPLAQVYAQGGCATHEGDFVVKSSSTAIPCIVTGALHFESLPQNLDVSKLEKVGGGINMQCLGDFRKDLSFDKLVEVGTSTIDKVYVFGCSAENGFEQPLFTEWRNVSILIGSNSNLFGSLSFPSLKTVKGNIDVRSNPNLAKVSANEMMSAGGTVDFDDNKVLATLSLPRMATIGGSLRLHSNKELKVEPSGSQQLPVLKEISADLSVYGNFPNIPLTRFKSLEVIGGKWDKRNGRSVTKTQALCTDGLKDRYQDEDISTSNQFREFLTACRCEQTSYDTVTITLAGGSGSAACESCQSVTECAAPKVKTECSITQQADCSNWSTRAPTASPTAALMSLSSQGSTKGNYYACGNTATVTVVANMLDRSEPDLYWRVNGVQAEAGKSFNKELPVGKYTIEASEDGLIFYTTSVEVVAGELPNVILSTANNRVSYLRDEAEPIELNAVIDNRCPDKITLSDFNYEWKVTDQKGNAVNGIFTQEDNDSFSPSFSPSFLPRVFTKTDEIYTVSFTATEKQGNQRSTSAEHKIRIGSKIYAIVDGNKQTTKLEITKSSGMFWQLDAAESYLADAYGVEEDSTFTWDCEVEKNGNMQACPFDGEDGEEEKSTFTVQKGAAPIGKYYITLTFTSKYDGKVYTAKRNVEVNVVERILPTFDIFMQVGEKDVTQVEPRIVQPYDSVIFNVNMGAFNPAAECNGQKGREIAVTHEWSFTNFNTGNLVDVTAGDRSEGLLQLAENSFKNMQGQTIKATVKLTACGGDESDTASIIFVVNSLPILTGEPCKMEPAVGYFLDTIFVLSCPGYYSPAGNELSYNYEYNGLSSADWTEDGSTIFIDEPQKGKFALKAIIKDSTGGVVRSDELTFEVRAGADESCHVVKTINRLKDDIEKYNQKFEFLKLVQLVVYELSDRGSAYRALSSTENKIGDCVSAGAFKLETFRDEIIDTILKYIQKQLEDRRVSYGTTKNMVDALHHLSSQMSSMFLTEDDNCMSLETGDRCINNGKCRRNRQGKDVCDVELGGWYWRHKRRLRSVEHPCHCIPAASRSKHMGRVTSLFDTIMTTITQKRQSVLFKSVYVLVHQKLASYCNIKNNKILQSKCGERKLYEAMANQLVTTATDDVMLGGKKTYDSAQGTFTVTFDNDHYQYDENGVFFKPVYKEWKHWYNMANSNQGFDVDLVKQMLENMKRGIFPDAFSSIAVHRTACATVALNCETDGNFKDAGPPMKISFKRCVRNIFRGKKRRVCFWRKHLPSGRSGRRLLAEEDKMLTFNLDIAPEFADEALQKKVDLHKMFACGYRDMTYNETTDEAIVKEEGISLEGCQAERTIYAGGNGEYGTIECKCDDANREFVPVRDPDFTSFDSAPEDEDKTLNAAVGASSMTAMVVAVVMTVSMFN